jgi:hypothetical protein
MKKANKARKPSKAKARTQKKKRQRNPVLEMLNNLDDDMIAMLQQSLQKEMGFGSEMFDPEDPVDLFSEYLENCASDEVDEDTKAQLLSDLVLELGDLKVGASGGDREAREKIQTIQDLLDNAIEDHLLQPIDLMLTGKIFAEAGWAVPDRLRQALADSLRTDSSDRLGAARDDLVSSLLELAEQAGQNPFDVHEDVSSLLAGLPPEASVMLLGELVAGRKPVIDQAVAGFVLNPDAVLARSAAETLAASATRTPAESSMIERLVRMRPWLPQSRQAHLDATIRAMRLNALPPERTELPKLIKCYVSACDGSGTRGLFVTQRAGTRYQLASVMMKYSGVAQAMIVSDLSRSEMDDIVRQMKSAAPVSETDLAGVARMLELAIADNFASGDLPPFKLVEVVESLGLGPFHPDHASPKEIIAGLLADLPPEQTNPTAVAKAHADMLNSDFKYQWFEAGEAVDDLLFPVKGFNQRVAKLLTTYLPERRPFWARQCAISALAMRGNEKTGHSSWRQLALVGRDIASDLPIDQIPFLKQVAEMSVRAFEGQL